jgi:asparagine synthase (glutamine-hydrolysing)
MALTRINIRKKLAGLIIDSIASRIPDSKFGILFSGGIDSTLIALICKQLGVDFTCYTAALEGSKEDAKWAEEIAKEYGFELKIIAITHEEVQEQLSKVVNLLNDSNVIKAGVGVTLQVACRKAAQDKIKVIFSGTGSDELFAGYGRFKDVKDINKECKASLEKMFKEDVPRDSAIASSNGLKAEAPFLDERLIEFALNISGRYKIEKGQNKVILREVAEQLGLKKEFAQRKKKAAQYGSNFDKAIEKAAKKNGFKTKTSYLGSLLSNKMNLGVLFSGGKDSISAMHMMKQQNCNISCLITIKSSNPDSYMFHTPAINLTELQAEALGLPLMTFETKGEKEKELKDLENAMKEAKLKFKINGIITGALFSDYQRERIEKLAENLGLKVYSPLWHLDQEQHMLNVVENLEILFTGVAAYGLDQSWLGRIITKKDVDKLVELKKKYGINIAGEGGEFESLVLDCPMFRKKIEIDKFEIAKTGENSARLIVKKASLAPKTTSI